MVAPRMQAASRRKEAHLGLGVSAGALSDRTLAEGNSDTAANWLNTSVWPLPSCSRFKHGQHQSLDRYHLWAALQALNCTWRFQGLSLAGLDLCLSRLRFGSPGDAWAPARKKEMVAPQNALM